VPKSKGTKSKRAGKGKGSKAGKAGKGTKSSKRRGWSLGSWRRKRAARKWREANARRRAEHARAGQRKGSKPIPEWSKKRRTPPPPPPPRDDTEADPADTAPAAPNEPDGPDAKILPFRRPVKGTARGSAMVNPYRNVIDTLGGTITVENALAALDYVYGLPELVDAIAERLVRDGATYCNEFPTDPRAGEVAQLVGVQMQKMHGPVEKFGAVFERVHEAELARLRNPRPHEEKWDIRENVR
jgi:hypothetical protein